MTLYTRTNNNAHADMYRHTEWGVVNTHQRAFIAVLPWVYEIFRISRLQNKRQ